MKHRRHLPGSRRYKSAGGDDAMGSFLTRGFQGNADSGAGRFLSNFQPSVTGSPGGLLQGGLMPWDYRVPRPPMAGLPFTPFLNPVAPVAPVAPKRRRLIDDGRGDHGGNRGTSGSRGGGGMGGMGDTGSGGTV